MTFTDFWSQYPAASKHKGSKKLAERRWNGLSKKRQQAVMDSLPHYAEHLSKNEWLQPKHASTYLNPANADWETYLPDSAHVQLMEQEQTQRLEEIRKRKRREAEAQERMWQEKWEQRYGRPRG